MVACLLPKTGVNLYSTMQHLWHSFETTISDSLFASLRLWINESTQINLGFFCRAHTMECYQIRGMHELKIATRCIASEEHGNDNDICGHMFMSLRRQTKLVIAFRNGFGKSFYPRHTFPAAAAAVTVSHINCHAFNFDVSEWDRQLRR